MNKALRMLIPLVVLGLAGVAAGYFLGDPGMRDEYVRNYGMAGAMAGMVVGAILVKRAPRVRQG